MRDRLKQKYGYLWPKVQVDSEDRSLLEGQTWYIYFDGWHYYVAGTDHIKGWWVSRYLHRMIMNVLPGMQVDHINGDTLDNRKCNLRLCTHKENGRNRKLQGGSSKYKGVSWHKQVKRWRADIKYHEKQIHLGLFDDEIGAAFVYDVAARILFGEFARLNFQAAL